MSISKDICPVPYDQQPLNEYNALKKSLFFAWSLKSPQYFLRQLFLVFCLSISLSLLLVFISNDLMKNLPISLSFALCVSTLSIELILIRLYLGWSYVLKRLLSATIFYEESGWYDGQIWVKSADILIQDRLVGTYQINPFLSRIKKNLIFISTVWLIEIIIIIQV